ncbi:MAG: ribonuclease III [Planctomycetia bacterium]|nr:ribonuclease III [Planctomycetia bacterium]
MNILNLDPKSIHKLNTCQEAINYQFKNPELLIAALTHSSGAVTPFFSNERLEFLGDAVLGMLIVEILYHRCKDMMEGQMTQIKSVVVSRVSCSKISKTQGLGKFLFLGKGMEHFKCLPDSLLANVQESIIGAIYLDGGMNAARTYVTNHFEEEIEENIRGTSGQNFKTLLQQYSQQNMHQTPLYVVLDERGPDHNKCFKVCVSLDEINYQGAWGKNKKEAEQRAAHNAYNQIMGLQPPYPSDQQNI